MMCCISSIGPEKPTPKTKNEANTTTTAVDLGRICLHLPNRVDWTSPISVDLKF
jgi:hypothetical protein